jgi:hypothetical protein
MDTQTEIPTRMSTRAASGSRVPEHFQGGRRKSDCASMTGHRLAINLYSSALGEEQCTLARIDGAGVTFEGIERVGVA